MLDLILCKLVTGEEVLGEVVENHEIRVRLKNPVQIAVVRGKDGTPNVGFAPFPTYAEESKDATIDLQRQHIVYSYIPAEDFRKNYDQIFGLGLILPGEKKIITG